MEAQVEEESREQWAKTNGEIKNDRTAVTEESVDDADKDSDTTPADFD